MKKLSILLLLFFTLISYSQEKKLTIDYTVDYLIPKSRNTAIDTISIGFDKSGRYLWTNNKFLAKDLASSIFQGNKELLENAELGLVLDVEKMSVMLFFNSGDNQMFMNMSLLTFVPIPLSRDENKEFELVSEPSGSSIKVLDYEAKVYDVYPKNEPTDKISVAFNETLNINNNKLFNKFLQLIFAAAGSSNMKNLNLPNGLILSISNNDETILKAHHIDTKSKTITINYSFKIAE